MSAPSCPCWDPPFYESLPPLVGADRVPAIIDGYRKYYNTAMFDTKIYDGMVGTCWPTCEARDITLAVATSKPEAYASRSSSTSVSPSFFEVIGRRRAGRIARHPRRR